MSDVPPADVPNQSVVICEVCGNSTDVRWYCKNCAGSLCDTCRETHRETLISRKHAVVPRTAEVLRLHGPAKLAEPCPKHKSKEISAYCNRCQVACCVSCLAEHHNGHNISTIEDAYLSAEKRLNDYIRELDKDVKSKLDEMAAQTNEWNAGLAHNVQKAKDDVNAFRKEMKQAVDSSCDALIDKLDNPATELSNIMKEIGIHKQKVDELINQCTERVREGKLDIIKYTPPTPTSLNPKLNLPPVLFPLFVPSKQILSALKQDVGAIEYKEKIKPKPPIPKFDVRMIHIQKIRSFSVRVHAFSITTVGNNTAWIADFRCDTMYLYDSDGKVVRSLTVVKGIGIKDVVVRSSGKIIVSNDDKKVRCVSLSGTMSIMIDTAPLEAWGVCLTDRGEIVVSMRGQGERNHVAVYSSDGRQKVKEIRGKDAQGRQLITDPFSVVQNGEDLCVVNYRKNVVCVSETDDVRWVYDGTVVKMNGAFTPCCICKDKYHNLLVTDIYNRCVHYIDREGSLIQIILTQEQTGLVFPRGISVDDETGQVWVGSGSRNNVVVATYMKQS